MIKFSICIPTLNEEKYVGKLLDCLVAQKHKNFEVIVVDGKSKDKTKDVVLSYKDKLNIQFIPSPRRGVSYQRNYAEKHAKYPDVIFFDADVQINPDFLEKIERYLEKHDVDVLTSWNEPLSDKPADDFIYLLMNVFLLELIKRKMPAAVGCFIYVKKSSFEKVGGFDKNISFAEDYDLVKRFHDKGFKYALLKRPRVKVSVRRFDREGRMKMILKELKAAYYYFSDGQDYSKLQKKIKHEFGNF